MTQCTYAIGKGVSHRIDAMTYKTAIATLTAATLVLLGAATLQATPDVTQMTEATQIANPLA